VYLIVYCSRLHIYYTLSRYPCNTLKASSLWKAKGKSTSDINYGTLYSFIDHPGPRQGAYCSETPTDPFEARARQDLAWILYVLSHQFLSLLLVLSIALLFFRAYLYYTLGYTCINQYTVSSDPSSFREESLILSLLYFISPLPIYATLPYHNIIDDNVRLRYHWFQGTYPIQRF
jgi:hypothetical protein